MDRRPIETRVDAGRGRDESVGPGIAAETFRNALAEWAAAVTVVAIRDGGAVHGVTVTSFFPVSAEPPLVAVALGPNARVLPFLEPDARVTVSLLSEGQGRVATVLADAFPVGPSPFAPAGPPSVEGCLRALVCTVRDVVGTEGGARLVVARIDEVHDGGGERPLLYHRRGYRALAP